jgi:hypothetical protein
VSPSSDKPTTGVAPEVWRRDEAIARLRVGLLNLSDGEHSMCQIAAELGVFCRGFRRWPDGEFYRRWARVIGRSTHLSRPQMEQVADVWQLSEQLRLRVPLACDAQTIVPGACRGWNEFSNEDLEMCCDEILGRNVVVVSKIAQIAQSDPGGRTTASSTSTPGKIAMYAVKQVSRTIDSRPGGGR